MAKSKMSFLSKCLFYVELKISGDPPVTLRQLMVFLQSGLLHLQFFIWLDILVKIPPRNRSNKKYVYFLAKQHTAGLFA